MRYVVVAVMGLAMASPAMAQDFTGTPVSTGYQQLARGHYDAVIRDLQNAPATTDLAPERVLNLATALAKNGRQNEARALYMQVLAEPAIKLDMLSGDTATSHQIAQRGLAMIGQSIATR